MKRPGILASLVIMVGSSVLAVGSPAAEATFPGGNGDIAYRAGGGGVRAVHSDGTGDHLLVPPTSYGDPFVQSFDVEYAPDGSSVVFPESTRNGQRVVLEDLATGDRVVVIPSKDAPKGPIWSVSMSPDEASLVLCAGAFVTRLYTVGTDGSGLANVPSTKGYCFGDWSVDDRIVASTGLHHDGERFVTTMDPDGSNREVIATLPAPKRSWSRLNPIVPSWAPDGSAVAFEAQRHRMHSDIWSVHANGSGFRNLTDTARVSEVSPVYAPDGMVIAFGRVAWRSTSDLWVMDPNGADPTRISHTPGRSEYPRSWQST